MSTYSDNELLAVFNQFSLKSAWRWAGKLRCNWFHIALEKVSNIILDILQLKQFLTKRIFYLSKLYIGNFDMAFECIIYKAKDTLCVPKRLGYSNCPINKENSTSSQDHTFEFS